eukprot:TRINITY_DN7409_c0_g1_i6.p1 TRINITY_DN7409_c0_g1~~TRINITY_DN7409_c0_g1_i6.p1  ORF type:complete len:132 (-),score=9.48 TRINITY_DN7409_c0_g1_i6:63-458(-)
MVCRRGSVREWASAMKIQRSWRTTRLAKHLGENRVKEGTYAAGAILIQSYWRRKMTRAAVLPLFHARLLSALKIQRALRRHQVWRQLRLWHWAARRIQASWAEKRQREDDEKERNKFLARQDSFRRRSSRQ